MVSHRQSGNVLFLILIAVALFAALSYAVTSSSRSSGGKTDSEKNNLSLSTKLQFLTQMRTSIQRMRLTGGCADTDISFRGDASTPDWNNIRYGAVVTPANAKCNVFETTGGAMIRPKTVPPYLSISSGVKDIGTNNAELLWVEPFYDDSTFCESFSKNYYKEDLPTSTYDWSTTAFFGNLGTFNDYAVMDPPSGRGRHTFCYNSPDYTGWTFVFVLIER